jgi:hypothetical protein
MTETIVNKLSLKNIIDNAWDKILKTEYREIRKRVILSVFSLIIVVFGVYASIGMMAAGIQILLGSGVSKILIQRLIGAGVCVASIIVLGDCRILFTKMFDNVFNKQVEDGE